MKWFVMGAGSLLIATFVGCASSEHSADMHAGVDPGATGLRRLSTVINRPVADAQGQRRGRVHDVMLAPDRSTTTYVLIDESDAPAKTVHAPWQNLTRADDRTLRVVADVEDPFTAAAGAAEAQPRPAKPISTHRLLGTTVRDRIYNPLGTLTDVIVDEQGRPVLALISGQGGLLEDHVRAAVPWEAVFIQSQPLRVVIDGDREDVQAVAYARGTAPWATDAGYLQRVQQRFDEEIAPVFGFAGDLKPEHRPADGFWDAPYSASDDALEQPRTVVIDGRIAAIRRYRTGPDDIHGGTELLVKTDADTMWTVYIRSNEALRRQEAALNEGDQVTILGSPLRREKRDFLLASNIVMQDQIVRLPASGDPGIDDAPGPIRHVGPVDAFPASNPEIVPGSITHPFGPIPQIPLLPEAPR